MLSRTLQTSFCQASPETPFCQAHAYRAYPTGRVIRVYRTCIPYGVSHSRTLAVRVVARSPLRYCLLTPELQWQPRGNLPYLTGVAVAVAVAASP
jgi:hypothetical protein